MWLILTPASCNLGGFLPSLFCSPPQNLINISCTAALGNLAQIGSISFLWLRISRLSFHLPSRIASIDWSVVCSHTMTGFQRLSQIHVLPWQVCRRACVWDKKWFHFNEPLCLLFFPHCSFRYLFHLFADHFWAAIAYDVKSISSAVIWIRFHFGL